MPDEASRTLIITPTGISDAVDDFVAITVDEFVSDDVVVIGAVVATAVAGVWPSA